uniref:Putative tail protein n=1 Tax=viral metagenome TaxID=1070528 RepID=A0A6M3KD59_9ZZZZ
MAQSDQITASPRRNSLRFLKEMRAIFDTSTGHTHDGSDSAAISAGANTLDKAYDQGGAGAGRAIIVNDGAITMSKTDTGTENVLELSASPSAGAAGDALKITVGANSTGTGITIANAGSGNDITGTAGWSITKAGLVTAVNVALGEGTVPAGTVCYIARDNTGDLTVNALTGKTVNIAIAGTDVVSVSGATVAITGNLTVSGTFGISGNWDVAATLTVDELILDTDGVAPAGTNCYAVRDNAGDLTLNAITGKTINFAVNNTDEYTMSATVMDMNDNAIDNAGYLVLNTATAPAGTEVYVVHDNTGDLTLNAKTGKSVLLAVAGTDEYTFDAASFIVAAANTIKFAGNTGIIDSAGNEIIYVTAVGSAVNYLNVRNAATANPIILECLGTADRGFEFHNDQSEQMLILTPVATADTEFTILNSVGATNAPIIRTSGIADKGALFQNAASETIFQIACAGTAAVNWMTVQASDTGAKVIVSNDGQDDIGFTFNAKNAEPMLTLSATAAATTSIDILSMSTGVTGPAISVIGETNVNLRLVPNGTGAVDVAPETAGTAASPGLILDGDVNTGFFMAAADKLGISTGGTVRTEWSVTGMKVGGTADCDGTAGTNVISIFNGTAPVGALANGISLYSNAGEFYALDAAGNATLNSPHAEDGDYIVYSFSAKKGKTVTIQLEKMMNKLAEKFPKDFQDMISYDGGLVHHNRGKK